MKLLLLLFLIGCQSVKENLPPKFHSGNVVTLKATHEKVTIIYTVHKLYNKAYYDQYIVRTDDGTEMTVYENEITYPISQE